MDEANRTAHYGTKVEAYASAQRKGVLDDQLAPDHLVFLIIGLAAWWFAVPQLARMRSGARTTIRMSTPGVEPVS